MIWLLLSLANASEEMKAGEVLKEDSYVFSMEEIGRLQDRISELEAKEKKLELYISLVEEYEKKENLVSLNDEYKDQYIENLKKINTNNQLIIDTYNRKDRFSRLEKYSYFTLGVGIAYGSIYMGSLLVK